MPTTLNTNPPHSERLVFSRDPSSCKAVFQDQGHSSQLPLDPLQSELRLCGPEVAKPDDAISSAPSVHWHHQCCLHHGSSSRLSDNVSDSLESLSLVDPATEPGSQQPPCGNCPSRHHSQTRWQATAPGTSSAFPLRRDSSTTTHSSSPAHTGYIPGYAVPHTSCRQAALWEDDVTVDDLAGYMDQLLHLPKPMSDMAELMYAWFVCQCVCVCVLLPLLYTRFVHKLDKFLYHFNMNSFHGMTSQFTFAISSYPYQVLTSLIPQPSTWQRPECASNQQYCSHCVVLRKWMLRVHACRVCLPWGKYVNAGFVDCSTCHWNTSK